MHLVPNDFSIPPDELAATRATVRRELNFLPDGTPIDMEIYNPPDAATIVRLVSERARAAWPDRPELFAVGVAELDALRVGATALGFVVRESDD